MRRNCLDEWMRDTGETYQSLAQRVGCSISFLTSIRRGEVTNSMRYMQKLEELSKYCVDAKNGTYQSQVNLKSLVEHERSKDVNPRDKRTAEKNTDD